MKTSLVLLIILGTAAFAACDGESGGGAGDPGATSGDASGDGEGADDGGQADGDDDGGDDGGGAPQFGCCLNGEGYSCPDQAAAETCAGQGVEACLDACPMQDPTCPEDCFASAQPDPSGCEPDPAGCSADDDGSDDDGGGDQCIEESYPGCEDSGDCCSFLVCNDAGYCESMDECAGTAIPCDLDLDCCDGLTCQPRNDGQPGGSCQ